MSASGTAWPVAGLDTGSQLRLRAVDLPADVIERITTTSADIVEFSREVHAIVVTTRHPESAQAAVRDEPDLPVIVMVHAGGERTAAALVREGAAGLLGEGNEAALWGLVDESRSATSLLSSFERRFGLDRRVVGMGVDAATGLSDLGELERRLGAIVETNRMPAVVHARVASDRWAATGGDVVIGVQRRRFASMLAHVCSLARAELYSTGPDEFTMLVERSDATTVGSLAERVVDAGSMFRDRGLPLRVVVGFAIPARERSIEEVVDRARRASEVATAEGSQEVLNAAQLERGLSETTELDAFIRLLDEVEPTLPQGLGHSERVGRMTAELGRLQGVASAQISRWHLAGHLHDVGRVEAPARYAEADLPGDQSPIRGDYPQRGAGLVRVAAGPDVAAIIAAHREHYDGSGVPDGRRGEEIPHAARALAVAHSIDDVAATSNDRRAIEDLLQARSGTMLDPGIVAVAIENLSVLLAARG